MSLLNAALLDPAELCERQVGGDGGGQRQLVVGASCSLQFQTWKSSVDDDISANRAGLMERMQMEVWSDPESQTVCILCVICRLCLRELTAAWPDL